MYILIKSKIKTFAHISIQVIQEIFNECVNVFQDVRDVLKDISL